MSADLACPACDGGTQRPWMTDSLGHCMECRNAGRRRPELHEWDALVAERDRLLEASNRVDRVWTAFFGIGPTPFGATSKGWIADVHRAVVQLRAALDSDPDLAERTRRIRADE